MDDFKMIKKLWKDKEFLSQNLTIKDMQDLIEYITPWLESMELKFSWDYAVNQMGLSCFIWSTMAKIYEIVNTEYKEEYELYPKQMDFKTLWSIISESDIADTVERKDKIWVLVKDKILEISKEVLS